MPVPQFPDGGEIGDEYDPDVVEDADTTEVSCVPHPDKSQSG